MVGSTLTLSLVLGCSSDGGNPGDTAGSGGNVSGADDAGKAAGPSGSTGPGDWTAGDYPPDLMGATFLEITGVAGQQDQAREYKVHVPPGYDPAVPAPVVFCFHGLGQNGVMFCNNGANMVEKSDDAGFVLVMPNGVNNSWNGGACCAGDPILDDVALVRAIFEEVGTHVNVDLDRVYAMGLSTEAS
jgi:predicted peptidase